MSHLRRLVFKIGLAQGTAQQGRVLAGCEQALKPLRHFIHLQTPSAATQAHGSSGKFCLCYNPMVVCAGNAVSHAGASCTTTKKTTVTAEIGRASCRERV